MEEDIELIEEFSREFRNATRFKLDFPITMYIHDDTHNAITNLLKDYKKLKQDNFEIKQTYRRIARHLIDIKQIELAEYMLAQIKDVPVWTVGDGRDYVSKQVIRDKIEELRPANGYFREIAILNQLLEEE